ncbi:MAG: hypothetical protein KDK34_11065 [Leptospiraceae bacterium]|nr:hypothetical protein [Leptospiraceae bacterium]
MPDWLKKRILFPVYGAIFSATALILTTQPIALWAGPLSGENPNLVIQDWRQEAISIHSPFGESAPARDNLSTWTSFSVPIRMPMEASIGSFYIYQSTEYALHAVTRAPDQAGTFRTPEYYRLTAGMPVLQSGNWRLVVQESILSVMTPDHTPESLPPVDTYQYGNDSGVYAVDSSLQLKYQLERSELRLGLTQRNYLLSHGLYRPGDLLSGEITLAYGLGDYSLATESYPYSLLFGLTSHYQKPERWNGEEKEIADRGLGTLFFKPGVEVHTPSVSLQATLEMPIVHYRPEPDSYAENIRATLGVRYTIE